MRTAILVSFDLIRRGEAPVALAAGSLLAQLSRDVAAGVELNVHHISINLLDCEAEVALAAAERAIWNLSPSSRDVIAVSAYVWSERITKALICRLREGGFTGTLALGGYQVSYASAEALPMLYPGVDVFITGYGEEALRELVLTGRPAAHPQILSQPVDFESLPSPYLGNTIPVEFGQGMVRLESKRGCPFRCSFCAHRDLRGNRVHPRPVDRVKRELAFFAAQQVGKINFVDPVFNQGPDYLGLLEYMLDIGLGAQVALQSRFELIRGAEGDRFLDLADQLGAHLEFGLQTAVEEEGRAINRRNRMDSVAEVMRKLASRGISYEVSLIYGLPGQTLDSFRSSIRFVRDNGCQQITAWPLMLLRGTELFEQREKWGFEEGQEGRFDIPVVRRSGSFSERDWRMMMDIADGLAPNSRV